MRCATRIAKNRLLNLVLFQTVVSQLADQFLLAQIVVWQDEFGAAIALGRQKRLAAHKWPLQFHQRLAD